jgi:HSP20 family protein
MPRTKKSLALNVNNDSLDTWPNQEEEGQLTIDVYQTPSEIVIRSAIAGVDPKDLDISINNDMVTIRGERKEEETVSDDDYFYRECFWGAFSRSVILPAEVDTTNAKASFKNGILTIRLPKIEKARVRKLSVEKD